MELKLAIKIFLIAILFSFNRTFMELKQNFGRLKEAENFINAY